MSVPRSVRSWAQSVQPCPVPIIFSTQIVLQPPQTDPQVGPSGHVHIRSVQPCSGQVFIKNFCAVTCVSLLSHLTIFDLIESDMREQIEFLSSADVTMDKQRFISVSSLITIGGTTADIGHSINFSIPSLTRYTVQAICISSIGL